MKSLIWRSFLQYINVHYQGIKILNNFFKEILEGQSFSKIKQQTLMSKFDCYIILFLQLLPKHSAASILQSSNKHKKNKDKKKQVGPEEEKPGTESVRKNRENFTRYSVVRSWNLTTCMWAIIPGRSWWLKILCIFLYSLFNE